MNSTFHVTADDTSALIVHEPASDAQFPVEAVARLAHVSRHQVGVYCRRGLVHALGDPNESGWTFDLGAVAAIRRLEQLRAMFQLNMDAACLVAGLAEEVEQLRRELQFLREQ